MRGMKYEDIDANRAGWYLDNDDWVAQQKLDGTRVMVHSGADGIHFKGAADGNITFAAAAQHFPALTQALHNLPEAAVLDCELIIETGVLWVFDLPYLRGFVKPESSQAERRQCLEHLMPLLAAGPQVRLVPEARGAQAKRALYQATLDQNAEGIVLKDSQASYQPGRRTASVLKVKHVKTIDCVVVERNAGGTTSATLALAKDGQLKVIGACSMIGKPDLRPGECCEVKFLYVTESYTLYQPRLMRARPDKVASDCGWRQIEHLVTSRKVVTV